MKRFIVTAVAALLSVCAFADEPKNVKLLTGLSNFELQRTMNLMRAALGVHCDYCHVVTKEKGWDWASDDKKTKLRAREMISMTMQTNQNFFNGRAEVSCNTCHRGAINPVSQPLLPQAQPPFPTPVEQRVELPSLVQVVEKYAKALGNVDPARWTSATMIATREAPDGTSGAMDIAEHGPNIRVHFLGPQGEITQVLTADGGWTRDKDGTKDMTPSMVDNFKSLRDSFRLPLPSDIPANARVVHRAKIDSTDAWLVVAPLQGRYRERLYFNPATGLLMRRVILMQTPIGDIPQQTDFDDYRDVNGTMVPFRITVASVDPWVGSTRKYSEVRLGARVDDAVFKKE